MLISSPNNGDVKSNSKPKMLLNGYKSFKVLINTLDFSDGLKKAFETISEKGI